MAATCGGNPVKTSGQHSIDLPQRIIVLSAMLCSLLAAGCRGSGWLEKKEADWSFSDYIPYVPASPIQPSDRTKLLLRRYDLFQQLERDPLATMAGLQVVMRKEPSADKLYAYAELANLAAARMEKNDEKQAFDLFATSVAHAYLYLFDERFQAMRNAYDPQFRGACDLYNRSLDRALRIVNRHDGLRPGLQHVCHCGDETINFRIVSYVPHMRDDEFERFEFVSDYRINGLANHYRTYGLGAPLIAVRRSGGDTVPIEKHYPPGLSIPVTAYLRITPRREGNTGEPQVREAVLELHDPLSTPDLDVEGRAVPLESDSTTPLAYFLDNIEYTDFSAGTSGLFRPGEEEHRSGLYMLEPYQPDKIPVLLVHGIWSTPITWVEMFNDLRSIPEIRKHYQFWFYFYPTGQPFVYTAADLREQMAQLRTILDPARRQPTLEQMVLVGHSMGGLISMLQTVDSGNLFWEQVAQKPLAAAKLKGETREELQRAFFFRANPSVQRVITIAAPFGGSNLSNSATQWLGRKLIEPPPIISRALSELRSKNPNLLREGFKDMTPTSIDMLAEGSPALKALAAAPRAPWVVYHNVVGRVAEDDLLSKVSGDGDGVVPTGNAHSVDAVSEIIVEAEHPMVHRHPRTVLEVRRILLEHLAALRVLHPLAEARQFDASATRFR